MSKTKRGIENNRIGNKW